MADRLKSLRRLEGVGADMARLAEYRLAAAEQACRELGESRQKLRDYVADCGALGPALARSALASLVAVDARLLAAERRRDAERTALDALRRRNKSIGNAAGREAVLARQAAEQRSLADVMEAWLARTAD